MKTISVKIDDYILDLLNEESKEKKVTRMEIIRAAVINFLLHRGDDADVNYINRHRHNKKIPIEKLFSA